MKTVTRRYWLIISVLLVYAVTYLTVKSDKQYPIIAAVLLFAPMFDRYWKIPIIGINRVYLVRWLMVLVVAVVIILYRPAVYDFALLTLFFTALPEEWFFRAYLMPSLGADFRANVFTSVIFSFAHIATHGGVVAFLVFFPSLFYGWLYQKTNDLVTVVLLHALSNIVFMVFINEYIQRLYGSII